MDDALGLTRITVGCPKKSRIGLNIRHQQVPLIRQSIYNRLSGYEDTNDAECLSQGPAMRVAEGWQASGRNDSEPFISLIRVDSCR